MRLLHFSDLHLGVESYGRLDPATGLSTRFLDTLQAFDTLVQTALEEEVDMVLFTGDAYKGREPTLTHQREFAKRIARLAREGIAVLLLAGNHDLPNALARATAVEIFDTLAVERVAIAQRPALHRLQTWSGPLQVAALPWPRRGDLLAGEEQRGRSPADLTRLLEGFLARTIEGLARQVDPALPAILAAHIAVATGIAGSEQRMVLGQDPTLLLSSLTQPAFDYIALGHLHRHQVVARHPVHGRPWAVYAGSLHRVDFGEEGEEKGFCLLELDPALPSGQRLTQHRFHPVPGRAFVTIKVAVRDDDPDPTEAVIRALESQRERWAGAIVRLMVTIPTQKESAFHEGRIRRALEQQHGAQEGAHVIAGIQREVPREARVRLGAVPARGWTPQDALHAYLGLQKVPPERERELSEYGERLIAEVMGHSEETL